MNKSKCPVCGSNETVKNGLYNGVQTYKCRVCGYRFRNNRLPSDDALWHLYQDKKQTISDLSERFDVSESTIKRRLQCVSKVWEQPVISGMSGFVHIDATYWGHNCGVLLGLDETTGTALYLAFIDNETTADYYKAVRSIEDRGYRIKGLIIDGKQSLFKEFAKYKIQMCQFHMRQIVRRYLTKNPRLKAAQALNSLIKDLPCMDKANFENHYHCWKKDWNDTLCHRSLLKTGKTRYTHRRLRSAMHSIEFYLPYLFTYQFPQCAGMPNTNNKIEGTFTDLKKNLNNHSGMNKENRKRFIIGFFLALNKAQSI